MAHRSLEIEVVMLLEDTAFLRIEADLEPIVNLGPTPYGERRVVHILGGRFEGPRLRGRIIPGGADWQLLRADGVADLRARYTLETNEGELILVRSDGLRHGPAEVIARLARGENVDPSHYYFRTILRFETSSQNLAWLNRILTVARGRREVDAVRLDVFKVL
jgi:Protein of unknown function (DUF3237)